MLNFEDLNKLLIDARAGSRAAECHGFLCGYLCITNNVEEEMFSKFLLADSIDDVTFDECCAQIAKLAADINTQISSSDFELQLLLPDDDRPLTERSIALMQWCQGFLSGLGVAGIVDTGSISAESRELIDDLYKICRLDADEINGSGEEEESALIELIEYVRMGAIMIHEEFHSLPLAASRPEVLH